MLGVNVQQGFWTNWDHDKTFGATLTLSDVHGSYLVAFLAIFTTFVGGQFWHIVCFVAHQLRARDKTVDALHHQRQTILRNTGTAGGSAWEFVQLFFNQRKYTRHAFRRSIPWIFLALTVLGAFATAGTFTGLIAKAAGEEGLIQSSTTCGPWDRDSNSDTDYYGLWKILSDTNKASAYARECYKTNEECNTLFVIQELPFDSSETKPCPFAPGACSHNVSAYTLDSGPLDSHKHFGINAATENRLTYRKQTTCSVLDFTQNYVRQENETFNGRVEQFSRFYLGPVLNSTNYTYSYYLSAVSSDAGYLVNAVSATAGLAPDPSDFSWVPVSDFNRTDADVSVVFLNTVGITYLKPVDDPLFSAHDPVQDPVSDSTYYQGDLSVAGLGCVDQHQFCNPNDLDASGKDRCTNLTGNFLLRHQSEGIGLNPYQKAAADVLLNGLVEGSIAYSVGERGADALLAQQSVSRQYQTSLPKDQWQLEIKSWFATALARMQFKTIEFATGPLDGLPGINIVPQTDAAGIYTCSNIKTNDNSDNSNYSVLGLALILSLGFPIVIVSFALPFCTSAIQKALRRGEGQRLQWRYDDKIRMQQMAFESKGINVWRDDVNSWPVTLKRDCFLPLGHFAKRQSSIDRSTCSKDE